MYIKGKLPNLLALADNKSNLLVKIVECIGSSSMLESEETLNIVQGMSDFWSTYPDLKKEFASQLKKKAKSVKDTDLKNLMNKSSNELVPPKIKKKEESNI